jgi:hypothetical protein
MCLICASSVELGTSQQLVFPISRPLSVLVKIVFFSLMQIPFDLLRINIGHYLGL